MGLVDALEKPEAGTRSIRAADQAKQRYGAELAVDDPCGFQLTHAVAVHSRRDVGDGGAGLIELTARAVNLEFGDRFLVGAAPAEDVLAASLGMPENLVNLCFILQIELADGEGRRRPAGRAPGFLG